MTGILHLKKLKNVVEAITELATCNSMDIPEDSRFLLEIDPIKLDDFTLEQKENWVAAMKTAKLAGHRRQIWRSLVHCNTATSSSSRVQSVNLYRIKQ